MTWNRGHHTLLLLALLAVNIGGQALAWVFLPFGWAVVAVVGLTLTFVAVMSRWTAAKRRRGWL